MSKAPVQTTRKLYLSTVAVSLAALALTGCGAGERLANVGKPPPMTAVENPQMKEDYKPVSMPMPSPKLAARQPNSLWDSNRQAFFKDQRAADIGDILTVLIQIDDQAQLENETERSRSSTESAGLNSLLGYETKLDRILPGSSGVDNENLADFGSTSRTRGEGTTEREEKIEVKLAALVTQILPNGNFVIHGSQEVRVNFEKRILNVDGVIRPQDISIHNTINYEQIAEARISYGGQGHLSDVQQPRYGQQVYDILFPF